MAYQPVTSCSAPLSNQSPMRGRRLHIPHPPDQIVTVMVKLCGIGVKRNRNNHLDHLNYSPKSGNNQLDYLNYGRKSGNNQLDHLNYGRKSGNNQVDYLNYG